jgi:hypothetical protein
MAPGQLMLKGVLDNRLQTCGDGAPQESVEHREVCRHMHGLRVDLHLNPQPDPLQPDLAAVSGPLHAPDQGAEPAHDLVNGGLQTCASLLECAPMLHRERHDSRVASCVMRVTYLYAL